MKARRTVLSNKVFRLPGGTEDNDLWTTTYDHADGGPCIGSTWVPSDEERQAIADGANIELLVWGIVHPPVAVRLSTYELGAPADIFVTGTGQRLINVHQESECAGRQCPIHRPSEHHMRSWPLHWRDDRAMFERICPHGVGHPDPDALQRAIEYDEDTEAGVHGCDGCCDPERGGDRG